MWCTLFHDSFHFSSPFHPPFRRQIRYGFNHQEIKSGKGRRVPQSRVGINRHACVIQASPPRKKIQGTSKASGFIWKSAAASYGFSVDESKPAVRCPLSCLICGRAGLVITGGKYNHPKQSRLRARGARHYWRKVQPPKAVSFAGARGSFGRICGARLPRHALLKGSEGYAFRFDSVFLTVEPMAKPTVAFSYFFSF